MFRTSLALVAALSCSLGVARADKCVDRDKAVAMNDAAKKAAETSYQKALAAKKLKPAGLQVVELPSTDPRYLPAGYKLYVVKEVDTPSGKLRVITDARGSCGGPSTELVQQGNKVFRVERAPRVRAKKVETCECTYLNGGGCGLAQTAHPIGYVLPDGVMYAGTISIEYVVDEIQPTHAGLCPPPQPVP